MSALILLLGSVFLFLGIYLSLNAKELQMLGFCHEARAMGRLAFAMAILGFTFWMAGYPQLSPDAKETSVVVLG